MIAHIVTKANREAYAAALAEMFRQRHEIFVQTKQWRDLRVVEGAEIDAFDTPEATYILVINDVGELEASLRLLPTCRPHLLQALAQSWGIGEVPVDFGIWEWSRYLPGQRGASHGRLQESRAVLIAAALEFAVSRGIHTYSAICDVKRFNMFPELGWEMQFLSGVIDYGQGKAAAITWAVGQKDLNFARAHLGLERAVSFELPPIPSPRPLSYLQHSLLNEFWGEAEAGALTAALAAAAHYSARHGADAEAEREARAKCGTLAEYSAGEA